MNVKELLEKLDKDVLVLLALKLLELNHKHITENLLTELLSATRSTDF